MLRVQQRRPPRRPNPIYLALCMDYDHRLPPFQIKPTWMIQGLWTLLEKITPHKLQATEGDLLCSQDLENIAISPHSHRQHYRSGVYPETSGNQIRKLLNYLP